MCREEETNSSLILRQRLLSKHSRATSPRPSSRRSSVCCQPTQIAKWKKQLLDSAASVFESSHVKAEALVDVDALYKKIGKLEMERDFLVSAPGVIGHLGRDDR